MSSLLRALADLFSARQDSLFDSEVESPLWQSPLLILAPNVSTWEISLFSWYHSGLVVSHLEQVRLLYSKCEMSRSTEGTFTTSVASRASIPHCAAPLMPPFTPSSLRPIRCLVPVPPSWSTPPVLRRNARQRSYTLASTFEEMRLKWCMILNIGQLSTARRHGGG
jgi:hypothetical protein